MDGIATRRGFSKTQTQTQHTNLRKSTIGKEIISLYLALCTLLRLNGWFFYFFFLLTLRWRGGGGTRRLNKHKSNAMNTMEGMGRTQSRRAANQRKLQTILGHLRELARVKQPYN
jgi:hypothetical protein